MRTRRRHPRGPRHRGASGRRRILIGSVTSLLVLLGWPVPAAAASLVAASQTPGGLAWITLTDTRGISVWNYELSIDRGGGVIPNPGKMFWSSLADLAWGVYKACVVLIIAFLDWVVSGEWLHVAASPFVLVGTAVEGVVEQIGVGSTFLVVAAVAATFWVSRGMWATGVWELTVSLVIGALAAGVFAHPIQQIAGEGGWIRQAQTSGQELAVVIAGEDVGSDLSKQMVDVFIRKPVQLVNFGQILDGGGCEGAYTNVVRGGPYGSESDIRDAVKGCEKDLGEYAENPSPSMLLDAVLLMPGGLILVVLIGSIGLAVLVAGLVLLMEGAKGAWNVVVGLLPGAARGPLFASIGTVATRLALLVISSIFIGLVTLLVMLLMESGESTAKIFMTTDAVLIAATLAWWRQHRNIKAASAQVAAALAKRPGASPVRLPSPSSGSSLGGITTAAFRAAQLLATRKAASAADGMYNNQQYSSQQLLGQIVIIGGAGGRVPPPPGRRHTPQAEPTLPPGPPPPPQLGSGASPRGLPPGPTVPQLPPARTARELPAAPEPAGSMSSTPSNSRLRLAARMAVRGGVIASTGGSSEVMRAAATRAAARAARAVAARRASAARGVSTRPVGGTRGGTGPGRRGVRPVAMDQAPAASGAVIQGRVSHSVDSDGRMAVSRRVPTGGQS